MNHSTTSNITSRHNKLKKTKQNDFIKPLVLSYSNYPMNNALFVRIKHGIKANKK